VHNTPDDLWLAINDKVYDFTDFAPDHPGGAESESLTPF
jgi:L-lactate dehydrogenase (cytochrome)